jgi:hypothetical protein
MASPVPVRQARLATGLTYPQLCRQQFRPLSPVCG